MKGKQAIALMIAALGLGLSAPAMAAGTPVKASLVSEDINRLNNAIDRADGNDTISEREAGRLRERVAKLRDDFQRLNGDGLTQGEVNRLEKRINEIRHTLRLERVDYDRRVG